MARKDGGMSESLDGHGKCAICKRRDFEPCQRDGCPRSTRRRLQFNPEPLRVVAHRLGEGVSEHRCDHWDGRGRCSSWETTFVRPNDGYGEFGWLCAQHRESEHV